jgi:hypothetical protein
MSDIIFYDYPTLSTYNLLSNTTITNFYTNSIGVQNGYYGALGSVTGNFNPSGTPSGLNQGSASAAQIELGQLITDINAYRVTLTPGVIPSISGGTLTINKNINYTNATPTGDISLNNVNIIFDAAGDPNAKFFIYSTYTSFSNCSFSLANGAKFNNIFWLCRGSITFYYSSAPNPINIYGIFIGNPPSGYSNSISFLLENDSYVNLNGRLYSSNFPITFNAFNNPGGVLNINSLQIEPVPPEPEPEPGPTPISNICFAGNTPIVTDQGLVLIKNIKPSVHTINNEAIVAVTRSTAIDKYLVCFEKDSLGEGVPNEKTIMTKDHKIFYIGELIKAYRFIEMFENVKKVKYNGEVLYNLVMKNYRKISVNNMICETLHPKNIIAKLYSSMFYENKIMTIEELNVCILKNDHVGYSKVVKKIGK